MHDNCYGTYGQFSQARLSIIWHRMATIPESFVKIKVTHVTDPSNFFVQCGATEEYFAEFEEFERSLGDHVCITAEGETLSWRQAVVVQTEEGNFKRGHVLSTDENENGEVDIYFPDIGNSRHVPASNIYVDVPQNIDHYPQVIQCTLSSVKPITSNWVKRAVTRFKQLTENEILDGNFDPVSENVTNYSLDILIDFEDEFRSLGDILVDEGLAVRVTPKQENEKEAVEENKVPEFDTNLLTEGPSSNDDEEEENKEEEEDFEQDLMKKDVVRLDSHDSIPYGRGTDAMQSIHEQIREAECLLAYSNSASPLRSDTSRDRGPANHVGAAVQNGFYPVEMFPEKRPRGRGRGSYRSPQRLDDEGKRSSSYSPHGASRPFPATDTLNDRKFRQSESLRKEENVRPPRFLSSPCETWKTKKTGESSKSTDWRRNDIQTQGNLGAMGDAVPKSKSKSGQFALPPVEKVLSPAERQKREAEYEIKSARIKNKVNEYLENVTVATIDHYEERLEEIVYPLDHESPLNDLPGPKELYIVIESIMRNAIEKNEGKLTDVTQKYIRKFENDEIFQDVISELLWKLQNDYVKLSTVEVLKRRCRAFCKFIGELYLDAAMFWSDSGTVHVYLINTLEKWAIFNKHGQLSYQQDLQMLYARCLLDIMETVGSYMEQFVPSEVENIFQEIKGRLLDEDLPREVKENFLHLIILRCSWSPSQGVRTKPEVVKMDSATQTDTIPTRDTYTEIELLDLCYLDKPICS